MHKVIAKVYLACNTITASLTMSMMRLMFGFNSTGGSTGGRLQPQCAANDASAVDYMRHSKKSFAAGEE